MEAVRLASGLTVITILLVAAAGGRGACAFVHRTIESDDGDVIDCVDIYQQPALKHAPPGSRVIIHQQAKPETVSAWKPHHQTWRKHGSCPAGTVPIRRESSNANPQVAERIRRSSPFGRPTAGSTNRFNLSSTTPSGRRAAGTLFNQSAMAAPPGGKVEVAAAYATNAPYLGARADVPCWKVDVHPNDFSMSYILVGTTLDANYRPIPGSDPPAHLTNQIAVGLVAWPSLFGDSLSRLFVYYTNDGGRVDGEGWGRAEGVVAVAAAAAVAVAFVAVAAPARVAPEPVSPVSRGARGDIPRSSFLSALGSSFGASSNSQIGGDLYGVTLGIHRDVAGMRWWVSVNDQDIGYYPETVFDTRFTDACYVELGGRVMDSRPGGAHTTTPMGSGIPPCAGPRFAATIMRYNGVNSGGSLFPDDASKTIATTPSCYAANPVGFDTSRGGFDVVFGGPGGIHCDQ
ncbi:unnamed protein product [Urochloa decumbens]|uniref:Neprosin PEP catalytic domain-containing protein n=1 Tax=Urochloa decumbens TaxID=240449 RepID=A0ABC9GQS2_9POAL